MASIFVVYDGGNKPRMAERKYSEYYEQLEKCTNERYEETLNFIGPEVDDPYVLPIPASPCTELLPDVEYPGNYILTHQSCD